MQGHIFNTFGHIYLSIGAIYKTQIFQWILRVHIGCSYIKFKRNFQYSIYATFVDFYCII